MSSYGYGYAGGKNTIGFIRSVEPEMYVNPYHRLVEGEDFPDKEHYRNIVTAQPQPQPNSSSTRVGVDKVISWTTTTTHHPT